MLTILVTIIFVGTSKILRKWKLILLSYISKYPERKVLEKKLPMPTFEKRTWFFLFSINLEHKWMNEWDRKSNLASQLHQFHLRFSIQNTYSFVWRYYTLKYCESKLLFRSHSFKYFQVISQKGLSQNTTLLIFQTS